MSKYVKKTGKTLRDIMAGHETAEILSLLRGEVVRKLQVVGLQLEIDAITEKVSVPLDTELLLEPWVFDRGSVLIDHPTRGRIKFCTEFDPIRFPDGTQVEVKVGGDWGML